MQNDLPHGSPKAREQDEMHCIPLLQWHFMSAQSRTTNGRTATQLTDAFRPAPVPIVNGDSSAGNAVPTCISDLFNTLTNMLTLAVRIHNSGFCVPAKLRDTEIVKRGRTTEAVRGYSIGPVLRTRTTLPEKGVANVA